MLRAVRLASVAMTVAVLCMPGPSASARSSRSSPGAFLPYRSDSVAALVQQVKTNSVAAKRYARHYGMSVEAVTTYFAENLILTTIKQPYKTQVWFVSYRGPVLYKQKILPAGSQVFATRQGVPILDWRCSNPLSKSLPVQKVTAPPKPKPAPPVIAAKPIVEVKPAPPVEIVQPELTAVMVSAQPVAAPIVTGVVPEVSAVPAISLPTVIAAAVPALFGAFSVKAHTATAVPEPASLVTLGLGISGVLLSRFRKRS